VRDLFLASLNHDPELLPAASGNKTLAIQEVILERNGLHFINANMLKPDRKTQAALDRDFRELVDSVTSSKSGD
jgi:hypothetical protein